MKKTAWFPGTVKPVRDGVYERDYGTGANANIGYAKFADDQWRLGSTGSVEHAERNWEPTWLDDIPWRGLAEDPNKEKAE